MSETGMFVHEVSVVWNDSRLLGFGPIDDTHQEFYTVVLRLLACNERNVHEAIAAVEDHLVRHFEQEETWMHDTDFPPRDCHIDEHAAVLHSVREVRRGLADHSLSVPNVRDLAAHLFGWFPGHADHLDSALVAWMSKLKHGGKPIVLRRNLEPYG